MAVDFNRKNPCSLDAPGNSRCLELQHYTFAGSSACLRDAHAGPLPADPCGASVFILVCQAGVIGSQGARIEHAGIAKGRRGVAFV